MQRLLSWHAPKLNAACKAVSDRFSRTRNYVLARLFRSKRKRPSELASPAPGQWPFQLSVASAHTRHLAG